jgi:TPR repeat protein
MSEATTYDAMKELSAKRYPHARAILETLPEDDEAQFHLAYLLDHGLGGARDVERARAIYQKLADDGDARGMYYLASLMLREGQLADALHYFEESAKLNHISAAYWSAELHNGAFGFPTDEGKYVYYMNQAASLGHLFAKRDQALRQMKGASNVFVWAKSLLRYMGTSIKAVGVAVRDPRDLRLR